MNQNLKYLYCIIKCSEERNLDGASPMGNPTGAVFTVPEDGLSLVVSDSPFREYETTRLNMIAHERVLERAMQEYTILPVKFGTIAGSSSPVEDMHLLIKKRAAEFYRLIEEIEGCVELGVKVFWKDEKAAFQELVAEQPAIRKLRDSLLGKPPQAVYYESIALGEMVKEGMDAKRRRAAAALTAMLEPLARRTRQNSTVGDKMVFNAAFLVDKAREPEFDQAVRKLEAEVEQRFKLKYVGPVPPYNFVNIVVNWGEL